MRNNAAMHEHRVIKTFIPSIAGFEAGNCNPFLQTRTTHGILSEARASGR